MFSRSNEPDREYGEGTVYLVDTMALTALVSIALIFRYTVKAWARWVLPSVSSPERVWGAEDERIGALKYDYISQPLAVTASMFSRCGMTWFLYTDRTAYFHMWEGIPGDGSVVCQAANVQTTIGFVQGAFNTMVDFFLTVLSAIQLWQFSIRAVNRSPSASNSFLSRFKRLPRHSRNRRIWQTVVLSGPFALSGCASIVKTYLLKSLGERNDFTHNIIPFVLWVKIENYSILLATCGLIIRLFLRLTFDKHNPSKYGYHSNSRSAGYGHGHRGGIDIDLDGQSHTQDHGFVVMSVFARKEAREGKTSVDTRVSEGGSHRTDGPGAGVTIQTDITVHVDEDGASTRELIRRGKNDSMLKGK
ncbi:hypothetical protein BDV06DRAFT_215552 [Aspergillus oleicola]